MTTWRDGTSVARTAADLELADAAATHATQHAPGGADEVPTHHAAAMWRPPAGPVSMLVTDFSTWSVASCTAVLADTADISIGTAAAKITTLGGGAGATLKKLAGGPYNLTGKSLVLWLKYDDYTRMSAANGFTLSVGDTSLANFRSYRFTEPTLPDTPYVLAGNWWRFTVAWDSHTSQTGTPNRAAVTDFQFRTVDDAAGTVTFHVGGIGTIPEPATRFPNGVCSLTFDDAFASQYTVARPRMDLYGFPGTAYVIREYVEGGSASRMTLAQLKALEKFSGWEIASHADTQAVHSAANGWNGSTAAAVLADMRAMKEWLAKNGFRGGDQIAIPQGFWSTTTYDYCRRMFQSARLTYPRFETWPPADPLRLRSQSVSNGTTVATMQARIDSAVASRSWFIITYHDLVAVPAQTSEYLIADFNSTVDYIQSKGMPVLTVGEVLRSVAG